MVAFRRGSSVLFCRSSNSLWWRNCYTTPTNQPPRFNSDKCDREKLLLRPPTRQSSNSGGNGDQFRLEIKKRDREKWHNLTLEYETVHADAWLIHLVTRSILLISVVVVLSTIVNSAHSAKCNVGGNVCS